MTCTPTYVPIERIECPSIARFRRDFDQPQKPVIITGAMRDWRASAEWDHAWFRRYETVPVSLSLERTHTVRSHTTTIRDYVDAILDDTDGGHYMDQFPLAALPELFDYVKTPYAPADRHNMLHLWIGPAHTDISFHKDNHDPYSLISNMFAQIRGRKRILLVSPDQDACMYPRPYDEHAPDEGAYWHSQVDHHAPDFARFPRFREARIEEAVLQPGEMLFVPGDYWHAVTALDKSVSVSCWWHTYRLIALGQVGLAALGAGRPFEQIGAADVDAFGGVDRLRLLADSLERKNPGVRQMLPALLAPDVRALFEAPPELATNAA